MRKSFVLSGLAAIASVVGAIREDPVKGTFTLSSRVSQPTKSLRRPYTALLSALANPMISLLGKATATIEGSATAIPDITTLFARQALQLSTGVSASSPTPLMQSATRSSWSPFLNKEHYRGLNVVNQSPKNWYAFKNATEWDAMFANIKSLPGNFNAVRLYSTTETGDGQDINHLDLALPAAATHNLMIHAGVWSGGDLSTARFGLEKAALIHAIQTHGCKNIAAVSVGNEDILFNHTAPIAPLMSINLLIQQINEISAILDSNGCCDVPVTHTDTWAEWTNPEHAALVQAVDFVTINVFPYWENSTIDEAHNQFWVHVNQSIEYAARFGKEVWLGETGWPFNGSSVGAAVPNTSNQQIYYSKTICSSLNSMNAFIYAFWDIPDTAVTSAPAFGLWDLQLGKASVDMNCPRDIYPFAGGAGAAV